MEVDPNPVESSPGGDLDQFLYEEISEKTTNYFPSQSLLSKIQFQQHVFDWIFSFENLQSIFSSGDQDHEAHFRDILSSPYFYLGQGVNRPCKWYLKLKRSVEPIPPSMEPGSRGWSLYLVLDEILWNSYSAMDQITLKTKLSLINSKYETLICYDEDWKCFTKLDQEEWIGAPVFSTWERIFNERDTLAEEGKLRIRLDLIIYGKALNSKLEGFGKICPRLKIESTIPDPYQNIKGLWDTPSFTDLIIKIGKNDPESDEMPQEFKVHRSLLGASSSILSGMIREQMEKLIYKDQNECQMLTIHLEDVESDVMEVILKHIYCKHLAEDEGGSEIDGISLNLADRSIKMAGRYGFTGTQDALIMFFLKRCDKVELQTERFAGLIYLACKYPPSKAVKMQLQNIYQRTVQLVSRLPKEEYFSKAMTEFPTQFLDLFFGNHDE